MMFCNFLMSFDAWNCAVQQSLVWNFSLISCLFLLHTLVERFPSFPLFGTPPTGRILVLPIGFSFELARVPLFRVNFSINIHREVHLSAG